MRRTLSLNWCIFSVATVFLAAFLILLGPVDFFTHSNLINTDLPEISWIPLDEFGMNIVLKEGESFSVEFVPSQAHFSGFYVYLGEQETTHGTIEFAVTDAMGKVLGTDSLDLEDLILPSWEKISIKRNLSGGGYTLVISNCNSSAPVSFFTLSDIYIPEETVSGNIPLRYAYDISTFTSQEKILISLFIFCIWLIGAAEMIPAKKMFIRKYAVLFLLTLVLTWNGLYGSMDVNNLGFFSSFQNDSERLVRGTVDAYRSGAYQLQFGYSLGTFEGEFYPYKSQYGFQGAVFAILSRFIGIETMHLLCSFLFAAVCMAVVYLIRQRYDQLFAAVFYGVFLLSPWTTNFARNLYWIEFIWFVPMAVGIFCSWKIDSKGCRRLCYAMAFLSLLIKSLCGYEYISTIMMGLIQFLLVDLFTALLKKERKNFVALFKTLICLGAAAVAGFAVAVMIHAYIKGEGQVFSGIRRIYEDDILRRTSGGNALELGLVYGESLDASVWQVLCRYFKFNTQIIVGVDANLFPMMCTVPLAIFFLEYQKRKHDLQIILLYAVTFFTSVSWFVLAKAHSYIHTQMNYVLWYFGFVQLCLYVIIRKLLSVMHKEKMPVLFGA